LLLGVGLRLGNASFASLKLDDFHSLHHARSAGPGEFFRVLSQDNHPPLSFLLLKGARALFGEAAIGLRLPAILAGSLTLFLAWSIARRLSPPARIFGTFLLAVSALHVEVSSDLRMYALLALTATGLLGALLDLLEEGRGAWRVAVWTALGLHAHYHFLYVLASLGAASAVLLFAHARYLPRRRAWALSLGLGCGLALPWYAWGFPVQLAHGLPPGGSNATITRFVEGLKSLVFWNVSVEGPWLRVVALGASAVLIVGTSVAAWSLARRARTAPAFATLLVTAALFVPFLTWLVATGSSRSGYEWRYLAGALPAFCLLAGALLEPESVAPRLLRNLAAFVGLLALLVSLGNLRDRGEENYRDAIAWIGARALPGDALVAADWQPQLFPHALAWDYYAPRLAPTLSAPLEHTDDFSLRDPALLDRSTGAFCCLRSLPNHCGILRALRQRFEREEQHVFGHSVYVHRFSQPRAAPAVPPR
jgi:4-amino-4-deoxy-L-arabinose transferase-like glycosyltransferase